MWGNCGGYRGHLENRPLLRSPCLRAKVPQHPLGNVAELPKVTVPPQPWGNGHETAQSDGSSTTPGDRT